MITVEMRVQMRRLVLVEGAKVETVARRFGVHHSVVRRALCDDRGLERPRIPSKLEPFKPFIVKRLEEFPELTAARLHDELRHRGFPLGISQLRRYVIELRPPSRGRRPYLRVETEPGEQAQVDWGSFGHMRVGASQRPLSVFSMVLSWSRALFIDFSLDQQMETFLRMHRRALEFFRGIPKKIVYDNLKSVVLHRVGPTVQFNPRFLAFAGHHLFEPVASPVRYPEFKGRVESSIKYVRHAFFYGRSFGSLAELRKEAALWLVHSANERIHSTTRERPAERLLRERPRLRPLPEHAFDTDLVVPSAIVSSDARVRLDSNAYSVPPEHVGKTVTLRADDQSVRVVVDGVEVARHPRCWDKRRVIEDRAHIDALLSRRPTARGPKHRERLVTACPTARIYLSEIARRRIHLSHEVEKLSRLLDLYGAADLDAAFAKAIAQNTFGARFVRALSDQARFARGQHEPVDLVVTGNSLADSLVVEPHPMESYDALFRNDPDPED